MIVSELISPELSSIMHVVKQKKTTTIIDYTEHFEHAQSD